MPTWTTTRTGVRIPAQRRPPGPRRRRWSYERWCAYGEQAAFMDAVVALLPLPREWVDVLMFVAPGWLLWLTHPYSRRHLH